ncbi:MAG: DNA topoisomerase (ATP-hydrolyzing) subunit B [Chloroflexi bacterium]|nr:DNA topoisomerase (ATP-hydrolyzing) subunit B [Chloroflexota bacterium]MBK6709053.1 DNA topoisomerase (ATP-hydrolyzing) subunit B [Chloroflexota bacterium]MBK7175771.1 DNA topoisomerase (ATP-hydrolyzing) subunit B [Chloroflexota bacterium]MBK7914828.1 DNA topoisomerase (ATP-hydrolyzing) subunit B [Chloroflexota bacterium]MBK8935986.1 DNA topoisomerase (ATP-hydrolyzing) subunit B [Chloroflexota bacterium]
MAKQTDSTTKYDENSIQVLKGLEAVRRRPGMYIGGTDIKALHHMVTEIVDNSIDEAMAGRCDRIEVVINPDESVTVSDNGVGIPVAMHPTEKVSALQLVMTTLHAGGKFDESAYKVSGGLHGVGAAAVNALSDWMEVTVKRDGYLHRQRYHRGIPEGPVEKVRKLKPDEDTGTISTFRYDETIFKDGETYRFETLMNHFREIAFVTSSVFIKLRDERPSTPREMSFYFEGGVKSFVRFLNRNRKVLHDPIYVQKEVDRIGVEVAMQYTEGVAISEYAFANTIHTPDGGTHLTGVRTAVTRIINKYARDNNFLKEKDTNFSSDDTREGITVVVSVKHPDPQFESQTKVKLMNAEVSGIVSSVTSEALQAYLEENPREARKIIDRCLTSSRARDAARKARDLVMRKSALESLTLPGKLADCSERDPAKCELYIVEGDSAGGTAKQGRDRHFQAILPLRGKILNTERARLDKILANNEVKALISALGIGIGETMDIANLRYHRIIIMTDADVDGSHIRTLLLTFFFRYMPILIEAGHLFIAQPPLFAVKEGKQLHYTYTEAQQEVLLKQLAGKKVGIQRYKGLGEMNAQQLWETTMDPGERTLLQVTIEDALLADRTFDMLMGSEVAPRKRFIMTHSSEVRNLDV